MKAQTTHTPDESARVEAHAPGRTTDRPRRASTRRRAGPLLGAASSLAVALCVTTVTTAPAMAEEYEPSNAGHPLRIAAYVVHPVGVIYDYLLLRPAFWVGSHQPFRTLFGRTD